MKFPRLTALLFLSLTAIASAETPPSDGVAFFDAKVLPLLQQRCYECHSHEKKIKGGLALDLRAGWETGGDNGPAIVPGQLEKSLLIKAVRYTVPHPVDWTPDRRI